MSKEENTKTNDKIEFILSKKNIVKLFWYLGILLIIGTLSSIFCITHDCFGLELDNSAVALLGGCSTALMGAAIFYMRKLYKSSIKSILGEPSDTNEKKNEIGLLVYYILRPVFAVCFSIVFLIALKASISTVVENNIIYAEGLVFLNMTTSFFIGFAAGDMIKKLEGKSKNVVDGVIKNF